jgi:hypothetical protein
MDLDVMIALTCKNDKANMGHAIPIHPCVCKQGYFLSVDVRYEVSGTF